MQPPFELRNAKCGSVINTHRIFERLAKALLLAHTTFSPGADF